MYRLDLNLNFDWAERRVGEVEQMDLVVRKRRLIGELTLMVTVEEAQHLIQMNDRWNYQFVAGWWWLARRNLRLRYHHLHYPHQESEP